MDAPDVDRHRFEEYVERLSSVLGHADRRWPLEAYLTGLLLPGQRKSVEPMAAKIDPHRVSRVHQAMHHFVAAANWDDKALLTVARDYALAQLERHAPVGAWVVDDTAIPKKGGQSVGVAWQYCGTLGKTANCQVAVSVSLVNKSMSVPAAWRLYLPEKWANDVARRAKAGVPKEVSFLRKWQIALSEIDALLADDLPVAPVVADSGYGDVSEFRQALTARGFSYAVGIKPETSLWFVADATLTDQPRGRRHSATTKASVGVDKPASAKQFAGALPQEAYQSIRWREGSKGMMSSRFGALRVRPAHRPRRQSKLREAEWLVIEWPKGEREASKYWLSTVPEDIDLAELVSLAKIRWRIERVFQELKDELGLDHYEGRGWRGFHHHGVLCMAAYCFLAAERGRLSPPQAAAFLKPATLPEGFKPRGSPGAARKA